ncbi:MULTISPECIES: thermonuclease family protein [unclassified Sphingomonas]|uniref:thermonuclease family protein n=1 Tax=unclassified Sphingomonas TaxID=196159 RepID=UPI002269E9E5|nr:MULTISPECIES: thermonuclease family protein [unclassified Sphingomonas]
MRLICIALLLSSCHRATTEAGNGDAMTAKAHAIDGDTVAVDYRLLGADAFEKHQLCRRADGCWPCGKAAQDFTSRLLKRSEITIRTVGTASYGRPVATVDVDGEDLGQALIENGLAVPRPSFLKADPARASRYQAAYDHAVAAHTGAHAGSFLDPADWRHGKRLACEGAPSDD